MVVHKKLPTKYKRLLMAFNWAKNFPDVQTVCRAYGLYELLDPTGFSYTPLKGLIQDGPQCGLVALAICMEIPTKQKVGELFDYAKENKFTNNGEMFSADYMKLLGDKYLENRVEVYNGKLYCEEIVKFLLENGIVLVPYDCDRNFTPCLEKGHKAHWAVISGVVVTDSSVYVVAKHGKSLNTTIWNMQELSDSNEQLLEFSPDRSKSDLIYVLPDGGIAGPQGLNSRSILIYPQYKS